LVEDQFCLLDDLFAAIRNTHEPAAAFENLHPQRAFESLDLGAQRRLAHVATVGGAAEVRLFRYRDDVFKIPECDSGNTHSFSLS